MIWVSCLVKIYRQYLFIKYKHTLLTNTSTVAFLFDLKVDSIDSIIKEFSINFLIDEKSKMVSNQILCLGGV